MQLPLSIKPGSTCGVGTLQDPRTYGVTRDPTTRQGTKQNQTQKKYRRITPGLQYWLGTRQMARWQRQYPWRSCWSRFGVGRPTCWVLHTTAQRYTAMPRIRRRGTSGWQSWGACKYQSARPRRLGTVASSSDLPWCRDRHPALPTRKH